MINVEVPVPINLPGVTVTNVETDSQGNLTITVETTERSVACRVCGRTLMKRHGCDRPRELRHLPVFGKQCMIVYHPHRYICAFCDNSPTTTATPIWHKANSDFTVDYENHVLLELVNSTIADVCVKEQLTEALVLGIVDRYIAGQVDWNKIDAIGLLGIDEIALKKGYKDYVTLVTGKHNGKIQILAVIKGRKKVDIKRFLKSIPGRLKKTIVAICTDMYDGYINAAKEIFKKKTLIVIDRFHVAKLYRKDLDKFRQKILRQLKKELAPNEYEKLKGAMNILRRKTECLTKKEKDILNHLFSHSAELAEAYRLALRLTQIFNTHTTKEEALVKLEEWIREVKASKLSCFNGFIKTLKKHKNKVANYFINRHTSAHVEGFNNKVKVLKRRCYGIFNLKRFFQRLYLDTAGYRELLGASAC